MQARARKFFYIFAFNPILALCSFFHCAPYQFPDYSLNILHKILNRDVRYRSGVRLQSNVRAAGTVARVDTGRDNKLQERFFSAKNKIVLREKARNARDL